MKTKFVVALWGIGAFGAMLFVCALLLAVISTRRFNLGVGLLIALGILAAWEGFKMFRNKKRSMQD